MRTITRVGKLGLALLFALSLVLCLSTALAQEQDLANTFDDPLLLSEDEIEFTPKFIEAPEHDLPLPVAKGDLALRSTLTLDPISVTSTLALGGDWGYIDWVYISGSVDPSKPAPKWTLTKISGSAATLYTSARSNYCDLYVSSINAVGTSTYTLTCSYDGQTASVPITIEVIDIKKTTLAQLQLSTKQKTIQVGEAFCPIDLLGPATAVQAVRDELQFVYTDVRAEGYADFYSMYSQGSRTFEGFTVEEFTFNQPAICTGIVQFGLADNYYKELSFTLIVTDTSGTAPAYPLTLDTADVEETVYVEAGTTDEFASLRMTSPVYGIKKPEWSLVPQSGTAATVRYHVESSNNGQDTVRLFVESFSGEEGDVVYALGCAYNGQTIWIPVTLHVEKYGHKLPTSVSFPNEFNFVRVGETFNPYGTEIYGPAGSRPPSGSTYQWNGTSSAWEYMTNVSLGEIGGNQVYGLSFSTPGYYNVSRSISGGNYNVRSNAITVIALNPDDSIPNYTTQLSEKSITSTVYIQGTNGYVGDSYLYLDSPVISGAARPVWYFVPQSGGDLATVQIYDYADDDPDDYAIDLEITAFSGQAGVMEAVIGCSYSGSTTWIPVTQNILNDPTIPTELSISGGNNIKVKAGEAWSYGANIVASPAGTRLPDGLETYFTGQGRDATWYEGRDSVTFLTPGYYAVSLDFSRSNLHYTLPLYFTVTDASGADPDFNPQIYYSHITGRYYQSSAPMPAPGELTLYVDASEDLDNIGWFFSTSAQLPGSYPSWGLIHESGSAITLDIEPDPEEWSANVYTTALSGSSGTSTYLLGFTYNSKSQWVRLNIVVTADGHVMQPMVLGKPTVNPASPTAGSSVIATAYPSGGTGNYTYSFYIFDTSGNVKASQEGQTQSTWTFTAPAEGTYLLRSAVSDGETSQTADSDWFSVTGSGSATPFALGMPSRPGDIAVGSSATTTVTTTGGGGSYAYNFYLFNSKGEIVLDKVGTGENSWTFTAPTTEGAYLIRVIGTDFTTVDYKDCDWFYIYDPNPATPFTLGKPSRPGDIAVGSSVTTTVTASGGGGSYAYNFYLFNSKGQIVQDHVGVFENSWTFTAPTTEDAYLIRVIGTDFTSVLYEDCDWFYVYDNTPAFVVGTPSYPGNLAINTSITVTANVSGGSGGYAYNYYLFNEHGQIVQDHVGVFEDSWTFTIDTEGAYLVRVIATDGRSVDYNDCDWFYAYTIREVSTEELLEDEALTTEQPTPTAEQPTLEPATEEPTTPTAEQPTPTSEQPTAEPATEAPTAPPTEQPTPAAEQSTPEPATEKPADPPSSEPAEEGSAA